MPNSLTTIHSIALVFSTQPPESVWGTGGSNLARSFSRQHRITLLPTNVVTIKSQPVRHPDLPVVPAYTLRRGQPSPRGGYLPASLHRLPTTRSGPTRPRHPYPRKGSKRGLGWLASPDSIWAVLRRFRNINRMSIDYACRPRLRSRLTQGRLA